jgi:hypothetical protein
LDALQIANSSVEPSPFSGRKSEGMTQWLTDHAGAPLSSVKRVEFLAALDAPTHLLPRMQRLLREAGFLTQQLLPTIARSFFERFDFLLSPTDPLYCFMLLKDVRKIAS